MKHCLISLLVLVTAGVLSANSYIVNPPAGKPVPTPPGCVVSGELTLEQLAQTPGAIWLDFEDTTFVPVSEKKQKPQVHALLFDANCTAKQNLTIRFFPDHENWWHPLHGYSAASGTKALSIRGLEKTKAWMTFSVPLSAAGFRLMNLQSSEPVTVQFFADEAGKKLLQQFSITGKTSNKRNGGAMAEIACQPVNATISRIDIIMPGVNNRPEYSRMLDDLVIVPIAAATARSTENCVYPTEIAQWSPVEKHRQIKNAERLVEEIAEAKRQGKNSLVMKKDDYRFGSGAPHFLLLHGMKNFTLDGNGSTIWGNGRSIIHHTVRLVDCETVTVKNLYLDCDPISYIQSTITSVDREKQLFTVKIDPGFPNPDTPELNFLSRVGSCKAIFTDPEGNYLPMQQLDWVKSATPIANQPGEYVVELRDKRIFLLNTPVKSGDRFLMPDRDAKNMFGLDNTTACTLENITIYAAGAMGIAEVIGKGGNTYRNIQVIRRPGTCRLLACNADIFHSIHMQKGPLIENCVFSNSCDDFINIHGFFNMVLEQESPRTLLVTCEYTPLDFTGSDFKLIDWKKETVIAGGKIIKSEIVESAEKIYSAKKMPEELRELSPQNRIRDFHTRTSIHRITIDQDVTVSKYDLLDTGKFSGSGSVIRNNRLENGTARGILLKGANSIIENNMIRNVGSNGILSAADIYFFENSNPDNIIINNNQLENINLFFGSLRWLNGNSAAIAVYTDGEAQAFSRRAQGISQNIKITNNRIRNCGGMGILAVGIDRLEITDNLIESPWRSDLTDINRPYMQNARKAIYLLNNPNAIIRNNTVSGLPNDATEQ